MTSQLERCTQAFYDWEVRGRGWLSYPYTVPLEPVFRPFLSHSHTPGKTIDDARRHTWASRLVERYFSQAPLSPEEDEESEQPTLEIALPIEDLTEVLLGLPQGGDLRSVAGWLQSLSTVSAPLSFELVGAQGQVTTRLALSRGDRAQVLGGLTAFVPQLAVIETPESLEEQWLSVRDGYLGVLEFGLAHEFMLPLARGITPDPLTSIIGALAEVGDDELAIVQVLFEEVRHPWAGNIQRSVVNSEGQPFFLDAPELTKRAAEKISTPLYGVILRIGAKAETEESLWQTLRRLGGGLASFTDPVGNELAPLGGDVEVLEHDLLTRSTHRSGMILSRNELLGLVHIPSGELGIAALWTGNDREKQVPGDLCEDGIQLGVNSHHGKQTKVCLPENLRTKHTYVIGASGTGKSTLLARMILEDIEAGNGVGVLDPHGDLIDAVIARISSDHLDDVILFDPSLEDVSVGWNMLGADSEIEREILASDLVGVFRRLATSWGDQMTAVLTNAVLSFLESTRGGTLMDLREFLINKSFRDEFLETVTDPHLRSWWEKEFALLVGRKPQAPILTRLNTFLGSKLIRRVVTERYNHINFGELVDGGGVFLGKLAQGAIGTENAALLGSFLVSRFHQVTTARAGIRPEDRRPFFLYLDEFHEVATPSMAALFSGARKYALGLTVAHQDLYQLHRSVPEVERAVLANAYTRIVFRVDDEDARKLERGFGFFDGNDLGNLETGEAICRAGRKDADFNLLTTRLSEVSAEEQDARFAELLNSLRDRYPRREALPPRPPPPVAPPSPPPEPAPAPAPATPGRGGAEHTYLQELVKRWGEERGWRAHVEHEIEDGGRVDVALIRDDARIAVEISVTTGSEHELGNIRKCLAAGFDIVALVSLKRRFLSGIERLVATVLTADEQERVRLVSPEELLALIDEKSTPREQTVAGYKVKVARAGPKDAGLRGKAVADVVLKSLRRMRKQS